MFEKMSKKVFEKLVNRLLIAEDKSYQTFGGVGISELAIDGFYPKGIICQIYHPDERDAKTLKRNFSDKIRRKTIKPICQNIESIEKLINYRITKLKFVADIDFNIAIDKIIKEAKEDFNPSFVIEFFGEDKLRNLLNTYKYAVYDLLGSIENFLTSDDYIHIAESKQNMSDHKEALNLFNQAFLLAKSSNRPETEISALIGCAECYFELKELDKAITHAIESIRISEEIENDYYISIGKMILAQLYGAKGELEKAYKTSCKAVESASRYKDSNNLARVSMIKAEFSLKTNRIDEAYNSHKLFEETIIKKGGFEAVLALELGGLIQIEKGNFKVGEERLLKASNRAKEEKLPLLNFEILVELGRIITNKKRFDEAYKIFMEACEIAQSLNAHQMCLAKLCLAEILCFMKKFNDALQRSEELKNLAKKYNLNFFIGEAHLNLSIIYQQQNKYNNAFINIKKSYEYFQTISDINSIMRLTISLGELCLKSNETEHCNEFISKYEFYKKSKNIQKALMNEIKELAFQIFNRQGEYEIALDMLNEVSSQYKKDKSSSKDIVEQIENTKKLIKSKIHLSNTFKNLIESDKPLELAGTDGAQDIFEANRWVLGPLLDWVEGTAPFQGVCIKTSGIGLIYSLWGQANFSRLILNLRYFSNIFHLSIEVGSVEEAREACRTFLPLTDCLTLIWKGRLLIGSGVIPTHLTLGAPQKNWKPKKFDDLMPRAYPMSMTPIVCCTLPPEILGFYCKEARSFVELGRLILAPGPMVGCSNKEHGILEEAFCKATNGRSIQKHEENSKSEYSIPLIFPYFPELDFNTLAKIIIDEQESLRRLRLVLLEWAVDIQKNGYTQLKQTYFMEKFKEMVNPIYEKFKVISKKLNRSLKSDVIAKRISADIQDLNISKLNVNTSAALSSSILWDALKKEFTDSLGLAGLACFRLMGLGRRWQLKGPQISVINPESKEIIRPEIFNWLKAPGELKVYMRGVKKEDK